MMSFKKTAVTLLALSTLSFASCKATPNNNVQSQSTTNTSATTVITDSEGGWFATFGEYEFYTNGVEAAISGYNGKETKIKMPDNYKGIPVVSIGWSAFASNKTIEEVTISDTIKIIGVGAFNECTSLKKVVLSDSVTKIDINCFSGCTSLSELNLTKNVSELGVLAFGKCGSLSQIGCESENETFISENGVIYTKDKSKLVVYPAGKNDETYNVNENTVTIADRAFEGNTHIKTIHLKNVADVGSYAFKDCKNLSGVFNDKTMTVAGGAFENTPYESIIATATTSATTTDTTNK